MPSRWSVVLEVGRDHSIVAWHTLLAGCSPLWAAEDPSAADSGEAGAFVRVGSAVSSRRWRVSRPRCTDLLLNAVAKPP